MAALAFSKPPIVRAFRPEEYRKQKIPGLMDGIGAPERPAKKNPLGRRWAYLARQKPLSEEQALERGNLRVKLEELEEGAMYARCNLFEKMKRDRSGKAGGNNAGIEKAIDALGRLMDSLNRIENSLPNVKDESLPGIKSEVSRSETLIGLVGGKGFERKHALESLEPMLKHKMPYEVY